jgi:hypothetical protein
MAKLAREKPHRERTTATTDVNLVSHATHRLLPLIGVIYVSKIRGAVHGVLTSQLPLLPEPGRVRDLTTPSP